MFSRSFEAMAVSTASERAVRIVTAEWLKEHLEAGGRLWLQLASLAFHGPFKVGIMAWF